MNPADHAITWIKVEKPTFDLVGVVLSSFELAGVLLPGRRRPGRPPRALA